MRETLKSRLASAVAILLGLALFEAILVEELLSTNRHFDVIGWIGVTLVPLGILLQKKIPAAGYSLLVGGLLAAIIFAAPTESSAVPLAAMLAVGIVYPSRPIRPTVWLGIVLGCWLISLGVANGFNRNWTSGAPLALLHTVMPKTSLAMLLNPMESLRQSIFAPEIFTEIHRVHSESYRCLILASILGPLAAGCAFLVPQTRSLAALSFLPAAIAVGWAGWDPPLVFIAACGAVLILTLPSDMDREQGASKHRFFERAFVTFTALVIILWPHIQRYLVTEYSVGGRTYYGQNDHAAIEWNIDTSIRVLRGGQAVIVEPDEFSSVAAEIESFGQRVSKSGEFVARAPLARQLVRLFPDEPEIQISTVHYFLDPGHQRIAKRGRDFTFTKRSDGQYFRSIHRYTRRFLIDEVRNIETPRIWDGEY